MCIKTAKNTLTLLLLILPQIAHACLDSEEGWEIAIDVRHIYPVEALKARLEASNIEYGYGKPGWSDETLLCYRLADAGRINTALYELRSGKLSEEREEEIREALSLPLTMWEWGRIDIHRALREELGQYSDYQVLISRPGSDEPFQITLGMTAPTMAKDPPDAERQSEEYIAEIRRFLFLYPDGTPVSGASSRMASFFRSIMADSPALADMDFVTKIRLAYSTSEKEKPVLCFVPLRSGDVLCHGVQ